MLNIREACDRGHHDHGWLSMYHTFLFGSNYDPNFTSFRSLRVVNEDRVQPGQGFGTHLHNDMEIVSYGLAFNPSPDETLHFYQIWLIPERNELQPSYKHNAFSIQMRLNRMCLVASAKGIDVSFMIHQDAHILLSQLDAGTSIVHPISTTRHALLQILCGSIVVNGESLPISDGEQSTAKVGSKSLHMNSVNSCSSILPDEVAKIVESSTFYTF